MKKVLFWLSCCIISAVLIGKFVANNASFTYSNEQEKCSICYECEAYLNGDVFYSDRLYTSTHNERIISNVKDAQERFSRLLEYGEGQFKYHRIVCKCSNIPLHLYTAHLEKVKEDSDARYERYIQHKLILLNSNKVNYRSQKGPND